MAEPVIAPPAVSFRNGLLRALPRADLDALRPMLRSVTIRPRQILHHARAPVNHVYFIEEGLVSVSARSVPSKWTEVSLIGSKGMTGISALLGDGREPALRRVVQVGGTALQVATADLLALMERSEALRSLLLRHVQVVLLQTSQSSACNATHSIKQRLSRWLLLVRHGLDSDDIPLTHAVLSRLLGIRRPSVTSCLGVLQREGAITNGRSRIQITAPEALQAISCDCHCLIRYEQERLLGVTGRRP